MTVAELIKELEKMPQDKNVRLGVWSDIDLMMLYADASKEVETINNTVYIKGWV